MFKVFLLVIFISNIVHGGRYPGIVNIEDVPDATDIANRIGACPGGLQGIVIAPRIIATVAHGGLNADIETNEAICINGQQRKIIRKVEEGHLGFRDLTLLFLDLALENIEICPILKLADGQTIPKNSGLHAISLVSNNIMLGERFQPGASMNAPANDTQNAFPYGVWTPHYGALNTLVLRHNFELLSVDNANDNPRRFIAVPGDSGSPCFASTQAGGFATVGVVSTVGDGNGASASYTYIGRHLDWINGVVARHYAAENQEHFRIQTVDENSCNFNPDNLALPTMKAKIELAKARYAYEQQMLIPKRMEHFSFLKEHISNQIPQFCGVLKELEDKNAEIFYDFQIQHFLNSSKLYIKKILDLNNLNDNIDWLQNFSDRLQNAINGKTTGSSLADIAFILNNRS